MGLQLVTPPSDYPVTLAEAKAQLSVDFTDDDDKITQAIAAATQALDGPFGWLERAIMPQTWDYFRDGFPDQSGWFAWGNCAPCSSSISTGCAAIEIPLPPLISVESISYADPDNPTSYLTLASSEYAVDNASLVGWIQPVTSWPTPATAMNAVRIRFVAGFVPVPADIKQAILMLVRDYYDQSGSYVVGGSVSECPRAVDALINGYRLYHV